MSLNFSDLHLILHVFKAVVVKINYVIKMPAASSSLLAFTELLVEGGFLAYRAYLGTSPPYMAFHVVWLANMAVILVEFTFMMKLMS